jgi:3-deoxy-manno-octulosonate cytidylyltransferase (CMP-KDO synthetase)
VKIIGVIPSRLGSTRLPEKPLQVIKGKLLVQRVYEQALKAACLDDVIIATDDRKIESACRQFGGRVLLTSSKCQSGTDRVAEVARKVRGDIYLNIQGDEPLIAPSAIDLVAGLFGDREVVMGTVVHPLDDRRELTDPNVVKAVLDKNNYVLYFSRSLIPYSRNKVAKLRWYKHLGLYGYRREFLMKFTGMRQTALEKSESLEQLRVLENGYRIKAAITKYDSPSIDTQQDLDKVRKILGG